MSESIKKKQITGYTKMEENLTFNEKRNQNQPQTGIDIAIPSILTLLLAFPFKMEWVSK